MVGWAGVVGTVLTHRSPVRGLHRSTTVQHFRCRRVEIHAERPLFVQLDGDSAGSARVLRAWVDPRALVVNARRRRQESERPSRPGLATACAQAGLSRAGLLGDQHGVDEPAACVVVITDRPAGRGPGSERGHRRRPGGGRVAGSSCPTSS
jgi:hypothetical protein